MRLSFIRLSFMPLSFIRPAFLCLRFMNLSLKQLLARALVIPFLAVLTAAPVTLAAAQDPQALELLEAAKTSSAQPEAFFTQVETILDKVVDFRYIARAVMGKEAFTKATPEQRAQFAEAFKSGLVRSYAKGIAGYAESDIKVVGATINPKDARRAVVRQEVSYEGNVHQLSYSMRQQGEEWKLINVILNGVNLGQSFSSQFSTALQRENGDIDKIIAGWLAES
jgi:phospholipid transport system substrate-binding protein